MSAELMAFLRERLDEDEQIARAVDDRSAPWDGQWVTDGSDALRTFNGHVLFYGHNGPLKPGLVDHIARHDPARVLAEVEAKRRILDEIVPRMNEIDDHIHGEWGVGPIDPSTYESLGLLRLLAAPYADHRDYQPEWAPDA
jgi:hypothetical protein